MSIPEGEVGELYKDFGLSRPDVEVQNTAASPGPADQQLTEYLLELGVILSEVERLKRLSRTPADWQALMMYIAGQKPRVTEMTSRAKRLYARSFGAAFDQAYNPPSAGSGRGSGVSAKSAEVQAKSEAGLAYEASDRLERSWRDLQDLMWACKSIADSAYDESNATPSFEAYPEHLFPDGA